MKLPEGRVHLVLASQPAGEVRRLGDLTNTLRPSASATAYRSAVE